MKSLIKLTVFVGLTLLIVGVIAWKLPANLVLDRLNWAKQDISYARIKGSLWEGRAEQVTRRDLMLGDVTWDFKTVNHPSPLSTTWKIEGKGLDYELNFLLDLEGQQVKKIRYAQGFVPAAWIDLSKAAPLVFLKGRLDIDLDHASPSGNASDLAAGIIRWTDAGLSGLVDESLGNIIITLRSDNRFTIADIQTDPAVKTRININGEVKFNGNQYSTEIFLNATEEKQYVIDSLAHLGTILPDGALKLTLSGRLPR